VGRSAQASAWNAEPARSGQPHRLDAHTAGEQHSAGSRQHGDNLRADNHYDAGHQYRCFVRHQHGDRPDCHAASAVAHASDRTSNAGSNAPAPHAHSHADASDRYAHANKNGYTFTYAFTDSNGHPFAYSNRYCYAVANRNSNSDGHAVADQHSHGDAHGNGERDRYARVIADQSDYPPVRKTRVVYAK
jgi:hypothetical protein